MLIGLPLGIALGYLIGKKDRSRNERILLLSLAVVLGFTVVLWTFMWTAVALGASWDTGSPPPGTSAAGGYLFGIPFGYAWGKKNRGDSEKASTDAALEGRLKV